MKSGQLIQSQPIIVVVTGAQAAGKSTVARLLAERFAQGAHVEADVLHNMIVSGAEWARGPGLLAGEAVRQLRLRLKNMCLLGISFFEAGFTAVLDDIILGERWDHLQNDLQGYPFRLIVLAPRLEAVARRDSSRAKGPLGEEWARYLDNALRATMSGKGDWVDSSDQSPSETVDEVICRLFPNARVGGNSYEGDR